MIGVGNNDNVHCISTFKIVDYIANNSNQLQNLSFWNDHIGDMKESYRNRPLRCFAYIIEGGTCKYES